MNVVHVTKDMRIVLNGGAPATISHIEMDSVQCMGCNQHLVSVVIKFDAILESDIEEEEEKNVTTPICSLPLIP